MIFTPEVGNAPTECSFFCWATRMGCGPLEPVVNPLPPAMAPVGGLCQLTCLQSLTGSVNACGKSGRAPPSCVWGSSKPSRQLVDGL